MQKKKLIYRQRLSGIKPRTLDLIYWESHHIEDCEGCLVVHVEDREGCLVVHVEDREGCLVVHVEDCEGCLVVHVEDHEGCHSLVAECWLYSLIPRLLLVQKNEEEPGYEATWGRAWVQGYWLYKPGVLGSISGAFQLSSIFAW